MAPNAVNIDITKLYTLTVTGSDLVALMQGLGEIPHKVAAPLEGKIMAQLIASQADAPP